MEGADDQRPSQDECVVRSVNRSCCLLARRVCRPTEAFGSIRPSTHIFERKGDSLPIDPAYTKADFRHNAFGDRAFVANHVRYIGNSEHVLGHCCTDFASMVFLMGRETEQQAHARQVQLSDLTSGFGPFLPEDGSRSTRLSRSLPSDTNGRRLES